MAYEVYEQKLDNNLFKIKIYRAEIYEEHWCRYIFMSALVLIRKLFATNFFFFFFFFYTFDENRRKVILPKCSFS